jgi:hypothetical protein
MRLLTLIKNDRQHCLRATHMNRLRRARSPREAAMRLVNHESQLIIKSINERKWMM